MDLTYHVSILCYISVPVHGCYCYNWWGSPPNTLQTSMTVHIYGIFDQFVAMFRFSGYWNVVHMIDRNKQDCFISEQFVGHRVVSVCE